MPLKLQHINADTTWLLSIPIPHPSPAPANTTPAHFNILIDPWLAGTQTDYHHLFSRQSHRADTPPAFSSIPAVSASLTPGKVDAILVCHDFTDHCHEETLRTAEKCTPVFAQGKAAGRVRGWRSFDCVIEVPHTQDISLRELAVDAGMKNANTMPEDICIAYLPTNNRWDMAGTRLHGATVITFGQPSDLHESCKPHYAVIYTPHGIPASSLSPWRAVHPDVDVLALIHGLDEIDMPWWLAGPINLGPRSALPLCTLLRPRVWVATHDEEKTAQGLVARVIRRRQWGRGELEDILKAGASHAGGKVVDVTVLGSGEGILLGR
ncbi:hypothetical protein FIBSPDRAFT_361969 [Athelia psychrophila]|uniref:Metallo-beta-lactamase domain-containing protein n=1 Tax=Athelia psychrophila TaxID=1759441 RepID=A0A166PC90_9AGAM|nr:hypothetical protein FIBSPDRAFT_361969 [Fibularhizoctonia sp. CBS 109695]